MHIHSMEQARIRAHVIVGMVLDIVEDAVKHVHSIPADDRSYEDIHLVERASDALADASKAAAIITAAAMKRRFKAQHEEMQHKEMQHDDLV